MSLKPRWVDQASTIFEYVTLGYFCDTLCYFHVPLMLLSCYCHVIFMLLSCYFHVMLCYFYVIYVIYVTFMLLPCYFIHCLLHVGEIYSNRSATWYSMRLDRWKGIVPSRGGSGVRYALRDSITTTLWPDFLHVIGTGCTRWTKIIWIVFHYTGVNLILGSKVQCPFHFETHHSGERGRKGRDYKV